MLLNFDKAGAEWNVVAYLTGDEGMLSIVNGKQDAHSVTASHISKVPVELILSESRIVGHETDPDRLKALREEYFPGLHERGHFIPRSMSLRQMGKKSNHGLNYDEAYKTFALVNEMSEPEAKNIVNIYKNKAYPGVSRWHRAIQEQLHKDRTLINCFSRKCYFMEAWGQDMFRQAYSFIPQSTVGDMVNEGIIRAMDDSSEIFQPLELLAQVHDSAEFQYLSNDLEAMAQVCLRVANTYMRPACQYASMVPSREAWEFPSKEREFYIETDLTIGFNKGDMWEVPLKDTVEEMTLALEEALDRRKAA